MPEVCNFIKKENLAQVFSCEFCEISKNTFFIEHLWKTASYLTNMTVGKSGVLCMIRFVGLHFYKSNWFKLFD